MTPIVLLFKPRFVVLRSTRVVGSLFCEDNGPTRALQSNRSHLVVLMRVVDLSVPKALEVLDRGMVGRLEAKCSKRGLVLLEERLQPFGQVFGHVMGKTLKSGKIFLTSLTMTLKLVL